jgi:hypothetical protein
MGGGERTGRKTFNLYAAKPGGNKGKARRVCGGRIRKQLRFVMNEEHPLPASEEIGRRLRIVAELRNLCLSLGRTRRMEQPKSPRSAATLEDRPANPDTNGLSVPS